jgi:hypothetical protein
MEKRRMPTRCPNCGHDNRDTAHFCVVCGRRDLQLLKPPAQLAPQLTPQPLAPHQPASLAPPPAQPTQSGWRPARPRWRAQPIVEGVIEASSQDEVYPPTDRAMILTKIGLAAAVMPLALNVLASAGIAALIILALGGGACLAVLGAVFGAFAKLFSLFAPRRRPPERKVTQVDMIVREPGGSESEVVLYGDHVAGRLRRGDLIQVFGRRQPNGAVRATRVIVVGAQFASGSVQRRTIAGMRPLMPAVAILVWIAAASAWLLVYMPLVLRLIR